MLVTYSLAPSITLIYLQRLILGGGYDRNALLVKVDRMHLMSDFNLQIFKRSLKASFFWPVTYTFFLYSTLLIKFVECNILYKINLLKHFYRWNQNKNKKINNIFIQLC